MEGFANYLEFIADALQIEREIADNYLHPITKEKLTNFVLTEVIVNQRETVRMYNQLVFKSMRQTALVRIYLFFRSKQNAKNFDFLQNVSMRID